MQPENVLAVAACISGIGMALSPLLQVYRMFKLKDAKAVSVPFLMVIALGASVWLAYGLSIQNWSLIIANGVSVFFSAGCAFIAYRMHHHFAGVPHATKHEPKQKEDVD